MAFFREGREPGARYSGFSVLLHWTLAVLVLAQLYVGVRFAMAEGPAKGEIFPLHLSIGATILLLTLVRLAWRVTHPGPPLPVSYPRWQRILARSTHAGLYLILIGMPLTGWLRVSASGRPLPEFWGLFPWPRAPVSGEGLQDLMGTLHDSVILPLALFLVLLHVAGAVKGQFFDRDGTLGRMLPIFSNRGRGEIIQ